MGTRFTKTVEPSQETHYHSCTSCSFLSHPMAQMPCRIHYHGESCGYPSVLLLWHRRPKSILSFNLQAPLMQLFLPITYCRRVGCEDCYLFAPIGQKSHDLVSAPRSHTLPRPARFLLLSPFFYFLFFIFGLPQLLDGQQ